MVDLGLQGIKEDIMPNWCEGTLRIRGTIENLRNFIEKGLEPVNAVGAKEDPLNVYSDDTSLFAEKDGTYYMKGSRRHFVEDSYFAANVENPGDTAVMALNMKAAWMIDAHTLRDLCDEFHLDMRIQAFECGMEFSQIIEIANGEVVKNDTIKYEDWAWDCPCPKTGG